MSKRASRRSAFALLGVVLVSVACPEKNQFVPVVTTITVSPSSRAFTALTDTQRFTAVVLDQRGTAMTGQSVTWGTSSMTVASVTTGGLVTAVTVGTAQITATIGSVSGSANVTVTQVPALLAMFDGHAQSAPVGTQLPLPVVVRITDAKGLPVPNVTVGFAVTTGGGAAGAPSATTNGFGRASSTWTLGNLLGQQTLTASSTGVNSFVFAATGLAAPPDTVIKNTVDGQSVAAGTPINPAPAVLVRDQFSNPAANIQVTFAVTGGGGLVTGATQFTNASGIATVGSWIAGPAGPQEMTATVTGTGIGGNPVTFVATSLPAGAPDSIQVFSGDGQTGLQGFPLNLPVAAQVLDASNNPVQGASVTFAVTGGGGSITPSGTTDFQGIARASWTITFGANTATASVAGAATPAAFSATGVNSGFRITLDTVPGSTISVAAQAAFDNAVDRWSRAIIGDLSNVTVDVPANACGVTGILAESGRVIDDLLIYIQLVAIDGQGGVLGSAGWCGRRPGATGLPFFGVMRFDTADLAFMESEGILEDVILHEMGHVLGVGTLWQPFGLLTGATGADPFFTGAFANQKFDDIGGDDYAGGGTVPVENCLVGVPPSCGAGTRDGHWRESVFTNELMTGYIDIPAPMSVVTIAQFQDLGYLVNLGEADSYALLSAPAARAAARRPGVYLKDDIFRAPELVTPRR